MNLFRSIAAVIGTLGVALAAGTVFQSADTSQHAGGTGSDPMPDSASASLVGPFSDAPGPAPLPGSELEQPRPALTERGGDAPGSAPAARDPGNAAATNPFATLRQLAQASRQITDLQRGSLHADAAIDDTTEYGTNDATAELDIEPALADCAIWLVVTPEAQAMLDLSLYAPCDGGARVEIRHEGLQISHRLSDDGQLMLALPALARQARVSITLPDGRRAEDSTEAPDIDLAERLVLGWQGADALALNAHVGGAAHGESGHIHPAQTHSPAQGAQYGFLTTLGDPALEDAALAQVYTFPAGLGANADAVDLAVEAAITAQSCGRTINARTQLIRSGRATAPRQMTLTMPECDGFEGFLVIDGLIPDLTLAQN